MPDPDGSPRPSPHQPSPLQPSPLQLGQESQIIDASVKGGHVTVVRQQDDGETGTTAGSPVPHVGDVAPLEHTQQLAPAERPAEGAVPAPLAPAPPSWDRPAPRSAGIEWSRPAPREASTAAVPLDAVPLDAVPLDAPVDPTAVVEAPAPAETSSPEAGDAITAPATTTTLHPAADVLPDADVPPAVGFNADADADADADGAVRHPRASRRSERWVMVASTVLGTLGLLVAVAAAGLDQVRYDQPGPCATYSAAHHGAAAFGCSVTAKHLAVLIPAIGIPLVVLLGLAVTWVPLRSSRGRLGWLGGLLLALVACAVAVALAYSALPKQS